MKGLYCERVINCTSYLQVNGPSFITTPRFNHGTYLSGILCSTIGQFVVLRWDISPRSL